MPHSNVPRREIEPPVHYKLRATASLRMPKVKRQGIEPLLQIPVGGQDDAKIMSSAGETRPRDGCSRARATQLRSSFAHVADG